MNGVIGCEFALPQSPFWNAVAASAVNGDASAHRVMPRGRGIVWVVDLALGNRERSSATVDIVLSCVFL